MSEQPIDQQYIESLKELAEPIKELREFISDMKVKKREMSTAFTAFSNKKEQLDELILSINNIANDYNNAKPDLDQKTAQISELATQSNEAKERINDVELHIREQKAKIDSDTQTVETTKSRFNTLKVEAQTLAADLTAQQTDLQGQIGKIKRKADTLKELEQELINLKKSAETSQAAAEAAHQVIQTQEDTFQKSIDQTNQKSTELATEQASLEGIITEIKKSHSDIIELHNTLLADEENEDGKSLETKFKEFFDKIDTKNEEFSQMQENQSNRFDTLYDSLKIKINSLLPDAGAAGLASSYYEAKMKYTTTGDFSSDTEDSNKKDFKKSKKETWKTFAPQITSHVFYMLMFIFPLAALVFILIEFDIPEALLKQPYAILFYKTTLTLPFIALSSFGLSSLVRTRRLYEEYNHKQRVMQLYHSFKDEIDKSSNEEVRVKLLNVMLDVVSDKPSTTLEKTSKPMLHSMQDQIDKIMNVVKGRN